MAAQIPVALRSRVRIPAQGGEPAEPVGWTAVRSRGGRTHRRPSWKGSAAAPPWPTKRIPGWSGSTWLARIEKPVAAVALGTPEVPMVGVQPEEVVLAVQ